MVHRGCRSENFVQHGLPATGAHCGPSFVGSCQTLNEAISNSCDFMTKFFRKTVKDALTHTRLQRDARDITIGMDAPIFKATSNAPTKPARPVDPPAGPILATTWKSRGPPTAKPEPMPPKMPAANEAEVSGETLTPNLLRKTSTHTEPTPAMSRPPESRLSRPGARVVCLWEKSIFDRAV